MRLEIRDVVDEVSCHERNGAVGRAQHQHRDDEQSDIREPVGAQIIQHAPEEWSDKRHDIIASASVATRAAAPGAPSRPRSELSLAMVSLRIESWSNGSVARTRLRAVSSPWMSSGTIFSPARMFGMPMKSTPVISI